MIEETALVVACVDGIAEVKTQRRSACGGCDARGGCGTSLLARVFGHKPIRLQVANPIAAQPGERVVIGVPESGLVRASLLLYALPLLGLLLGAVFADLASDRLDIGGGEGLSILCGMLGLGAGLWLARNFSLATRTNEQCRPVILRREFEPGFPVRLPD